MRALPCCAWLAFAGAGCEPMSAWDPVEDDAIVGIRFADAWSVGDHAWGVGRRYDQTTATVVHFDGVEWHELDRVPIQATSVWASGPDDVWAGGDSLQHWDGNAWSTIDLAPTTGFAPYSVVDVWGGGADDVWVIVDDPTEIAFPSHVLYFDGDAWTEMIADFADLAGFPDPEPTDMIQVFLRQGCGGSSEELWTAARVELGLAVWGDTFRGTDGEWERGSQAGSRITTDGCICALACSGEHAWSAGSAFDGEMLVPVAHWMDGSWRGVAVPADAGAFNAIWATPDGDAWVLGKDVSSSPGHPQIYRVTDDVATPTGSANLPELSAIVSTESSRTFAFGEGAVLEYVR